MGKRFRVIFEIFYWPQRTQRNAEKCKMDKDQGKCFISHKERREAQRNVIWEKDSG